MKAKEITASDIRVWCKHCFIRIAPNEDRITTADKVYHESCYSKIPGRKKRKTA
jgi:hypothetical protein